MKTKLSVKLTVATLCIGWLFASCATPHEAKAWFQEGKTQEDLRRDWAAAKLNAAHAALGSQPIYGSGFAAGYARGRAARLEKDIPKLFMESKGYQLVPISTVPPGTAYLKP